MIDKNLYPKLSAQLKNYDWAQEMRDSHTLKTAHPENQNAVNAYNLAMDANAGNVTEEATQYALSNLHQKNQLNEHEIAEFEAFQKGVAPQQITTEAPHISTPKQPENFFDTIGSEIEHKSSAPHNPFNKEPSTLEGLSEEIAQVTTHTTWTKDIAPLYYKARNQLKHALIAHGIDEIKAEEIAITEFSANALTNEMAKVLQSGISENDHNLIKNYLKETGEWEEIESLITRLNSQGWSFNSLVSKIAEPLKEEAPPIEKTIGKILEEGDSNPLTKINTNTATKEGFLDKAFSFFKKKPQAEEIIKTAETIQVPESWISANRGETALLAGGALIGGNYLLKELNKNKNAAILEPKAIAR